MTADDFLPRDDPRDQADVRKGRDGDVRVPARCRCHRPRTFLWLDPGFFAALMQGLAVVGVPPETRAGMFPCTKCGGQATVTAGAFGAGRGPAD